ncbi:MAG TPA: lasso peptide biosynthesis B2 protein [Allosphingosinicella sp.]|jgi:hypothetical protein
MAGQRPSLAKRLAPRRIALHAEALAAVVGASLAIRLLPFPRVVAARVAPEKAGDADVVLLRGAVRAWCRRVPWRALCFESALALRTLLRRRGVDAVLHYGMARSEGLRAHVWLSVDGETVIGGEAEGYEEVAQFPPARAR